MTQQEFVTKLKKINPDIRVHPGRWESSGLFVKNNGPLTSKGLQHVCGIPNPHYFKKHNWIDDKGRWHRGWKVVLRLLIGKKVVLKDRVYKAFGSSWMLGGDGESIKSPRYRTPQQRFDEDYGSHATLADKKIIYALGGV